MKPTKTRQWYIDEIKRVSAAIEKTDSESLKRDYKKYRDRCYKELRRLVKNDPFS